MARSFITVGFVPTVVFQQSTVYTERPVKSSEDEPSVESVSELVLGRIKERECRHEQQTKCAFVQFFTKQCFVTVQQQFFVHVIVCLIVKGTTVTKCVPIAGLHLPNPVAIVRAAAC